MAAAPWRSRDPGMRSETTEPAPDAHTRSLVRRICNSLGSEVVSWACRSVLSSMPIGLMYTLGALGQAEISAMPDGFEQSGFVPLDVSVRALVSQISLAAGQMTGSIAVSIALSNRRNPSRARCAVESHAYSAATARRPALRASIKVRTRGSNSRPY